MELMKGWMEISDRLACMSKGHEPANLEDYQIYIPEI
jgi:cytochrome c556